MSERATSQLPSVWALIRDIGTFVGGWTLIFMEVSRSEIRESVLVLAGSIIGVPGLWAGGEKVVEVVQRRRSGTDGSPSPPAESAESSS